MDDDVLATLLARLPPVDAYNPALDLGATLKPNRAARTVLAAREQAPADTLTHTRTRGGQPQGPSPAGPPAGYDILDELGRGGMGIVYRARQQTLRREVAVKRLQSDDDFMRQAFLTESRVTGELEHPNIVPVYALCEEEESGLWLVMKRIGGRTLAQLAAEMPVPRDMRGIDQLIDVILGVADALRFAHSRGILHRDIKPVNIMVGSFGEIMLLDWGIAAYFGEPDSAPESVPHVRDQDTIVGTPRYMPPEMAEGRGGDCGPWTDVYLLGATLYEAITGRPSRRGGTLVDVLAGARERAPLTFDKAVPPELRIICRRALAHEPSARYEDVASFQQALRDYLEHRESRALAKSADDNLASWRVAVAGGIDDVSRPRHYRAISEVISSYQHAHLLWPENTGARQGEIVARKAWAGAALECGDVGVAVTSIEGIVDEEADVLRRRITEAGLARRRAARFARWLGAGLIGVQLLLVSGLGFFGWLEIGNFTRAGIVGELRRVAPAAATALDMVDEVSPDRLDEVADALGRESELHLLLIDDDGRLMADSDSEGDRALLPVQSWPEVEAARRGVRESLAEQPGADGRNRLWLVRPWRHANGTEAVLLLSLPRDTLDGPLHSVLVGAVVALLLSFLIWSLVVLRISRRLARSLSRYL